MSHELSYEHEPATEPGALDGYLVVCSECGLLGKASSVAFARVYYAKHGEVMEGARK